MPEIKAEDEPSRLAILYSHPKWLVQELISMYGAADAEEILKADNTPAPVTLMVNTLKCSMQEAEKLLLGDGASVTEHPYLDDAFFVSGAGSIEKLTAFKNGCVYVQDAAARMAAVAASPKPGQTVIDVCAAPGGKSAACAVMMKNEGRIISCDIHEKKLGQITELAGRMGIRIIETAAGDGRVFNEKLAGLADVVITDVPCSGLGVIRKKPEIRYKAKEELSRLPEIQYGILENASKYVKPDGVLLYSTCTIMKSENESVVERFLAEHPEFEKESFTLPGPFGDIDGMTTLLPQQGGTDGFFICRMRRKN